MIKPTTELRKKEPSKKLRDAIHNAVGIFIKTAKSIDKVFSIGREEGFSDMEIGYMIRKEMSAANYDPRTIRRALPPSAKHVEKAREQKAFADNIFKYI
jgi:16S rRNA U1498 N3-methylase RsmE